MYRKRRPVPCCLALVALLLTTSAVAERFDEALFNTWVEARVGTGEPVYWYSEGTVRSYPDGELMFNMEGYDTARVHWPEPGRALAHQYNRKTYIFRDAVTNEVLETFNGEAVVPVAYPYQFISYELVDGGVQTYVEQGSGERLTRIGPGNEITAKRLGDTVVFTAPVYLDFPVGDTGRRYQAFENYDFFIQPAGSVNVPNQLSWIRYGACPPWSGGQPCVMHLITRRVDRYEEVPAGLREWIEANAPLWKAPPEGLGEIHRLQKGSD